MTSRLMFIAGLLIALNSSAFSENESAETTAPASGSCCAACDLEVASRDQPSAETSDTPSLQDLSSIEQLTKRFNADKGKPRMIFLLSPTCPMCIRGAKWAQEKIMEAYADDDFSAYVVWLPVLPPDEREAWNPSLIDDARAIEFWDETQATGKWFQAEMPDCPSLGPVAWDAIYVFGEDAEWNSGLPTPEVCATPIYRHEERILKSIDRVLTSNASHDG